MALRIARFVNLLFSSLLAGNAAAALTVTQPALGTLPRSEHIRAEQELTRRYGRIMQPLMPATLASCLAVLRLLPKGSPARPLTLAGTAGMAGMIGITAIEIPKNIRTLELSADAPPDDWDAFRAEWDQWNGVRTVATLAGWTCLCLAALRDTRPGR